VLVTILGVGCYFEISRGEGSPPNWDRDEAPVEATNNEIYLQYRLDSWRDQNGNISTDGLTIALAQREAYLAAFEPTDGLGDDGTADVSFIEKGPHNLGGRTKAIVVDPDDPNIIWVGAASGGVWKSVDFGQTWTASNGELQNYAINCLALEINPQTHAKTLWAGDQTLYLGVRR
jgi:hypothetical protein